MSYYVPQRLNMDQVRNLTAGSYTVAPPNGWGGNNSQYQPPQNNWRPGQSITGYGNGQGGGQGFGRQSGGSGSFQPGSFQWKNSAPQYQQPSYDDYRAGFAALAQNRQAPQPNFTQQAPWQAPDRVGGLDPTAGNQVMRASRRLGRGPDMNAGNMARTQVAGPAGNNPWEDMSLGLALSGAGGDPGQQWGVQNVPSEVFNQGEINALAAKSAAPTIRAYQDIQGDLARQATVTGGRANPGAAAALQARAALAGAGAMSEATRDATLQARQANANQALAAAGSRREDFGTDIAARLGLGNLGREQLSTVSNIGLERRGLDQRLSELDAQIGSAERSQDINRALQLQSLRAQMLRDSADTALGLRGQDVAVRGQDVSQRQDDLQGGLTARGQDINADLGRNELRLGNQFRYDQMGSENARAMAGLGLEKYRADQGTNLELYRQGMDRESEQNRLAAQQQFLNQQLGLDWARLGQQQQQFDAAQSQGYELAQQQAALAQQGMGQNWAQAGYNRDLQRQLGGVAGYGNTTGDRMQQLMSDLGLSLGDLYGGGQQQQVRQPNPYEDQGQSQMSRDIQAMYENYRRKWAR